MTTVTFADVVHQAISLTKENEAHAVILDLLDTKWVQRLRDVNQTANTRLLYMFSEHTRFGHTLGVAYLANLLMERLAGSFGNDIARFRTAISAAALLHDIGHLAPGSHIAYKVWFPNESDNHEETAVRIIKEDPEISSILRKYGKGMPDLVSKILVEDDELPPWTWEIISGGGWNVDRGNWTIVDSIMAGVSYGRYNIPALADSIVITDGLHLAIEESRLDAMMHFALSRHAMYRQMYQHRVLLAADTINSSIILRAKDLGGKLSFADDDMRRVLEAKSPESLSLETIFMMREGWWRYHVLRWMNDADPTLSDLCSRLINRRLFKTVAVRDDEDLAALGKKAAASLKAKGLDSRYYMHHVAPYDMHEGDFKKSMLVRMDDGGIKPLVEAEPLYKSMMLENRNSKRSWLVIPAEVKGDLGRIR